MADFEVKDFSSFRALDYLSMRVWYIAVSVSVGEGGGGTNKKQKQSQTVFD